MFHGESGYPQRIPVPVKRRRVYRNNPSFDTCRGKEEGGKEEEEEEDDGLYGLSVLKQNVMNRVI